MKKFYLLIGVWALYSCTNESSTITDKANSILIDAIDSSAIMNDSTKLPVDSTTTTVTH